MISAGNHHPTHVLVTGATGAIGPRVVAALCEADCKVRAFSLEAPPPGHWPGDVDAIIGDITDPAAVEAAMRGVDAVIHMAALLHRVNPDPDLNPRYERINVGGTKTVVEAACRSGVGRMVFFSTIAVYGASEGTILTEHSPLRPDSFYGRTKIDAERIVLAAKREDGTPLGTVLRLGAVYGARIKGNYRQLLLALARGRFIPIGPGTNRRTLLYDRDAARAALLALQHPDAAGQIFNVTDGQVHPMNTIIAALCDALGRRRPRLTLPLGVVAKLAGVIEDAGRICGLRSPISRATVRKYTEDMAVDGRKFCHQTGFVPRYDLAAGWRETVTEMKRSGDL